MTKRNSRAGRWRDFGDFMRIEGPGPWPKKTDLQAFFLSSLFIIFRSFTNVCRTKNIYYYDYYFYFYMKNVTLVTDFMENNYENLLFLIQNEWKNKNR